MGALGAGSAWALAGCGKGGNGSATADPPTGPGTTTPKGGAAPVSSPRHEVLALVEQMPEGTPVPVTVPGSGLEGFLVRRGGRVVMRSSTCTHQGCIVRWAAGEREMRCPCHGATYDPWTGAVLGGPAPEPLPSISVRVVSGRVYLA